ncbi:hypothetical protein ACFE04_028440 [Oxalis oulophora]
MELSLIGPSICGPKKCKFCRESWHGHGATKRSNGIEKLKTIEGKKLENNKFSLSIHYRHVKEDKYKDVASCVLTTVLEARPKFKWNKGSAVEFMQGENARYF